MGDDSSGVCAADAPLVAPDGRTGRLVFAGTPHAVEDVARALESGAPHEVAARLGLSARQIAVAEEALDRLAP